MNTEESIVSKHRRRCLQQLTALPLAYLLADPVLSAFAAPISPVKGSDPIDAWANAPDLSVEMKHVRSIIQQYVHSVPKGASLDEKRILRAGLYTRNIPLPNNLRFTRVDTDQVKGEWSQGDSVKPNRVLLYMHGGGFVLGTAEAWRVVGAILGLNANLRTFSLDYRLAPEHPYPAALEDALAAYRWLLDQGIQAEHIVFAGDSAGGGLALSTVFKAKAEGLPLPAGVLALSPWTDLTVSGASMDHPGEYDPFNQRSGNESGARTYLAGTDPHSPFVSPLFGDFHGLPPLLVQVGSNEAYLDDSRRLVEQAKSQGVDVTLQTWPRVFHGWQAWYPFLPEAKDAVTKGAQFLSKCVG